MSKRKNKKRKKQIVKKYASLIMNVIQMIVIICLLLYTVNNKTESHDINNNDINSLKNENYVFLGDSITDWYPFSDFYSPDIPIINSGFAGYTTDDLLKNMDDTVYKYNPTKVFIQIGTNDLNFDDADNDKIYNNIIKIIKNIHKNRPQADIYLESIYPVNRTDDEKINIKSVGRRENIDIVILNKRLKDYCDNNDVEYIDIYDELSDNKGDLKLEYTVEGLHLTKKGYLQVTNKLKEYIMEDKNE